MIDPKTIDKNAIIETETDKIYHLLDDKYNENFDFIERDENSIRLTFEFKGYDYENIEIKPIIINDYGVLKYDITIETYSSDNEVETPEAIMQHENYTTPPTEKKLNQIDKKAENELTIWNNSKSIILRGNSHRLITVENKVCARDCYTQVTHQHHYKGKWITLNTPHLTDIIPFIELREFFYSIGD